MTLAQWLKESKTSQSDLARRLNVTPACISMIAAGKRKPSLGLAIKLISESVGKITLRDLLP